MENDTLKATPQQDSSVLKRAFARFKKIREKAVLNHPGEPRLDLKLLTREGLK